ncbi:hypothetical protein NMY22_g19739 [Coprinellus aureogranulatus]|nr:hypothetical protein NMY22_g19739 [Coprinellus aureogranulatus]
MVIVQFAAWSASDRGGAGERVRAWDDASDEIGGAPFIFYHHLGSIVQAGAIQRSAMELNLNFKLSSDLLVHILQCLDPIDILAMRATCRVFYRAAASRSVWLAALDRVCEQHGIYKPTYPLEKMTLAELEHAASGPHRFIKFVDATDSTQPGHHTQPYLIRQIPYRKKAEEAGSSSMSVRCYASGPDSRWTLSRNLCK